MGFFDFVKGMLGSKPKEEKVYKKVKFDDLNNWIQNKKKDSTDKEDIFLKSIRNRVSQLTKDLEEETNILGKINIDEKKVEDRIKFIVKANLDTYIAHLRNLISNLNKLELNRMENAAEKIKSVFDYFEKKSAMSFQKITFLIGNELSKLGGIISNFFRDLKIKVDENKALIDTSKTISLVKLKLEEIDELKKVKDRFNKNITAFELSIKDLEDKNKTIEEDIKNIKKSEEYTKEQKKKEKLEKDKIELTKEINQLKDLIDFKFLANTFHSDEKKMSIIKNYRNDFKTAFNKNSDDIINLLDEAEINQDLIQAKIKNINNIKEEINNTIIGKDPLEDLNIKLEKIKDDINNLNSEKIKEQKKRDKFKGDYEGIINSIKDELNKIDVEII